MSTAMWILVGVAAYLAIGLMAARAFADSATMTLAMIFFWLPLFVFVFVLLAIGVAASGYLKDFANRIIARLHRSRA